MRGLLFRELSGHVVWAEEVNDWMSFECWHGWMMLFSEGHILAPNCLGRRWLLKLLKNLFASSSSPLAAAAQSDAESHVTPILFPLFCTRHSEFVVLGFGMWGDERLGCGRRLHYWMTMTTSQLCVTAASHPMRPMAVTEWPEFE